MSSTDCSNCIQLNVIINEQKKKISLIDIRMKDLIKAYKNVCQERDQLLAINSSSVLPLNDSKEQQKRLSVLESSVAEMSAICGKYESQRVEDKQTIERLTQKCEQLTIDLELSKSLNASNMYSMQTIVESKPKIRHRGMQTEDMLASNQTQNQSIDQTFEENKHFLDVSTQTDLDNYNKSKKVGELAIVVPTQRDSTECDQISNYSHSSNDSNINDYPVFASVSREIQSNNELFSVQSSHGVPLFYANELARKEIDLAEARLQAREYECALRELQWKYNTEKYKLQSRVSDLERNYSQMSSNQPMSHLNITYIRNVLIKLLNTKDKQQKQFMINAILTALEQRDRKPK